MSAYIEVVDGSLRTRVPLAAERVSLGAGSSNDIAVTDDAVSHLHALLELIADAWTIRDLGSRNGTYVNGERLLGQHALRNGDEIKIGATRLVYRSAAPDAARQTMADREPAPQLTPRERDLLRALCKPVLTGNVLTEPASIAQMADELVVTASAIKKGLQRLFDKFDLHGDERRRSTLANEAIARGAISLGELHPRDDA